MKHDYTPESESEMGGSKAISSLGSESDRFISEGISSRSPVGTNLREHLMIMIQNMIIHHCPPSQTGCWQERHLQTVPSAHCTLNSIKTCAGRYRGNYQTDPHSLDKQNGSVQQKE